MKKYSLIAFILIIIPYLCFSSVELSPSSWNIGVIGKDNAVRQELVITNSDSTELEVTIVPTCECIMSDVAKLTIPANSKKSVTLILNPQEETPGDVEKIFFINTNRKGFERIIFMVTGIIVGSGGQSESTTQNTDSVIAPGSFDAEMWLFYFPGCKTCEKLLSTMFPAIEKKLSVKLKVNKKDLNNIDSLKEYESMFAQLGVKETDVPVLLLGKTIMQGEEEIYAKLESTLVAYLAGDKSTIKLDKNYTIDQDEIKKKLSLIPAFFTGLIDGINPCAFATLVSLLTALTLAGKRKREILLMGLFFTFAVFITYFLIGLGFFTGLKALSGFPVIAFVIKWVLFGVLIVFASLSIWDYRLIRIGKAEKMVLQLPDFFKKQIQKSIKKSVRSAMIGLSALALGVLVSLFEMACTGQVYVPFITYVIVQNNNFFGYVLLLVYNIAFIIPLICVFAITYFGLSSKRLVEFFQKHMGKAKIALAILFIGLAILTIWN
jgi:cytochrome c biogenesis protein CcdA